MLKLVSTSKSEISTRLPHSEAARCRIVAYPAPDVWKTPKAPPRNLQQRLERVVRGMVWILIGPDQDRDDIVQDAFVRILEGLSKLRNPEWLEGWAARVTANTVYGALRQRRARPVVSWDTQLEPDLCVSRSDFESLYVTLRVARAFERLSEEDQALLQRRWFEAATIDQIAGATAWSRSTVKRRVRRAISRFERGARNDPEVAAWLRVRDGHSFRSRSEHEQERTGASTETRWEADSSESESRVEESIQ